MHLYVVLPILVGSEAYKPNSRCLAWIGIEYWDQISNRLEAKEKDKKFLKLNVNKKSKVKIIK